MKKEIQDLLFINNKIISRRLRNTYLSKHKDFCDKINTLVNGNYGIKEKIYIIYYGIVPPVCKACGCEVKLISFNKGFREYCSKKCMEKDPETREKVINTNLMKFGVEYPLQSKTIKKCLIKTNKKKYNCKYVLQSKSIKKKIKNTNMLRYGAENPFASKIIQERIKKTNISLFGVEHNSNSPDVVSKRKKTFIENYGVDNPNKNPKIIEKRNNTIIKNYIKRYSDALNIKRGDIVINENNVIINNLCPIHNKFKIDKYNLYNRIKYGFENICTKCNPISDVPTIKENEIADFIKSLKVNLVRHDRHILNGLELDIYIPDSKLAIEFNGLYWHSDKFQNKKYHLNKTNECEKQGIQLLHIFEDEWINKKEIVKSIIKSKLGLPEIKIFGRKCKVKEIDNKIAKEFLNENHIQGDVVSKIRLGLFYNNQLVSVMTFGKKRIALGRKNIQDNTYELSRFCTKNNIAILGGAGKLLSYFMEKYNPENIITFADRRYSTGNLYMRLGFHFDGDTDVNYWYFKTNEMIRHHRYKFRKDVLIMKGYDTNKTESQIMKELKYYRIYDCGNKKYSMIIKK